MAYIILCVSAECKVKSNYSNIPLYATIVLGSPVKGCIPTIIAVCIFPSMNTLAIKHHVMCGVHVWTQCRLEPCTYFYITAFVPGPCSNYLYLY